MLIHDARAVLRHMNPKRSVTLWLDSLPGGRHRNIVVVALANKLVRIAWALLFHQRRYQQSIIEMSQLGLVNSITARVARVFPDKANLGTLVLRGYTCSG